MSAPSYRLPKADRQLSARCSQIRAPWLPLIRVAPVLQSGHPVNEAAVASER
jgi:hypothetical protein